MSVTIIIIIIVIEQVQCGELEEFESIVHETMDELLFGYGIVVIVVIAIASLIPIDHEQRVIESIHLMFNHLDHHIAIVIVTIG